MDFDSSCSLLDSNGIPISVPTAHAERMLAEIDRIVKDLMRHDSTKSYPEQLEMAEEIYERQESRRIKLEAQRTAAAIAAIPTPSVSQTFNSPAIGSCMQSPS